MREQWNFWKPKDAGDWLFFGFVAFCLFMVLYSLATGNDDGGLNVHIRFESSVESTPVK